MNSEAPQSAAAPESGLDSADKQISDANAMVPEKSQFEYIIVGSGAGGGPLAARLALAGKKVLVIEAGRDPLMAKSARYRDAEPGEVTRIPGYYAAASEDAEMSWMFSVRHCKETARQAQDDKYNKNIDPNTGGAVPTKYLDPHPNGDKQGIFYPRASGIGGCTAHHAMITVAPNDKDWNYIANLTGDDSWRAGKMRGYFAKFERCQYLGAYHRFFKSVLSVFYRLLRRLVLLFDPRAVLDHGGHGFEGWAPTNFIDPFLISTIAKSDRPFFRVIVQAALGVLHGNFPLIAAIKDQLVRLRIVAAIDFNDVNTRRAMPEGVFLVPVGTEGGPALDEQGQAGRGRRFGVREFLLDTAKKYPDRLVIKSGAHVTRVLFEKPNKDQPPRAIGVECALGDYLYEASPLQKPAADQCEYVRYFAKKPGGEVILCGGAFNTPQLLMLSGIGDVTHLTEIAGTEESAPCAMHDSRGQPLFNDDGKPLRINLPGVGRNLQDRYEVTVVSELDKKFDTLDSVSFEPGDDKDSARRQWLQDKTGLYATNGGTLAVIRRSQPAQDAGEPEPDLFTFGAPAAFRGYYWNWSRELFKPTLGSEEEKRKLWSWVILKAYTKNHDGTVRLRTASPFDMPEICFDAFNEKAERSAKQLKIECQPYHDAGKPLPPDLAERKRINDSIVAESRGDLNALVDAVAFMRKVNAHNRKKQFAREIQPGPHIPDNSPEMEEWVKTQAWGHHASCTCRIGSDKWRPKTSQLRDSEAVLDNRFRVHGVKDLRIVDASIFPKIPGYFIAAPIFMVSEKAADTLIEDAAERVYPAEFKAAEAKTISARRQRAGITESPNIRGNAANHNPSEKHLEASKTTSGEGAEQVEDTLPLVGLALSGGGIRSATFALGVLQALAEYNRLRYVDFLSTVSGGGFIGSFLGRLFTSDTVKAAHDPCGRVQDILKATGSPQIWWLRRQANYIFATGSDLRLNLAIFWRNIFIVYFVVGALLFTLFGLLAGLPDVAVELLDDLGWFQVRALVEPLFAPPVIGGIMLSPWWWLPVLALGLGVLPPALGYWLAPKVGSDRPYPFFFLLAWLVLLIGAVAALRIPGGMLYAGSAALVLLLAWFWLEAVRWGAIEKLKKRIQAGETKWRISPLVRNRLSRSLNEAVFIFAALVAWVVLDTLAATFAALVAQRGATEALTATMLTLAPLLPLLRRVGVLAKQEISCSTEKWFSFANLATALGIPLTVLLIFGVDVLAHRLFGDYPGLSWGVLVIGLTFLFSLAIGRAFDFLNLSSLHATYAARLARTFQGASNQERVYSASSNQGGDIGLAHPKDDLPHHQYHPEEQGGPLHLINICVNETVDFASEREVRERKGLPMCVTPHGVSVGRSYFAKWAAPSALRSWQKFYRWLEGIDSDDPEPFMFWLTSKLRRWLRLPAPDKAPSAPPPPTALQPLQVSSDPNAFHVLARRTMEKGKIETRHSESANVESLSLGEWTAISGAAFTTGIGRGTRLPLALFMGLANVRLGYWWNSGIRNGDRPGRYPPSPWRRLKRLPVTFFRMQSMLLSEWLARFHGASHAFWYLSDGGHFEVTGLYELLRRRVPFMIVSDAGEDPKYEWGDVALLTQQARMDFGAQIEWLDLKAARARVDEDEKKRLEALADEERQAKEEQTKTEQKRSRERWHRILEACSKNTDKRDEWIWDWIDPDKLGALKDIRREGNCHGALARVTYDDSSTVSWILLLKPSLSDGLTGDIINYAAVNEAFPQQPTFDQVFDDIQWESYRALGQQIARQVFRSSDA